mmetsp:Transcript_11557/g.32445  ORF Transcript_11557/g.32445 Transcript_11557/m.32445 type:complete len:307 (+) Transcript_11557:911-1831(+)
MVSLFFLFGVSAKHFTLDVSTTVSQNVTTGSATCTSILANVLRRSLRTQFRYSSPVPSTTCSPLSSTLVVTSGYVLLTFLSESSIFGSSDGFSGSIATFTTASVVNWRGRKVCSSVCFWLSCVTVAVFMMVRSMPSTITHMPGVARSIGTEYRACETASPVTVCTLMSSSSSMVYASPSTFTRSPTSRVPDSTRPNAENVEASCEGNSLQMFTISFPAGSPLTIASTTGLPTSGPEYDVSTLARAPSSGVGTWSTSICANPLESPKKRLKQMRRSSSASRFSSSPRTLNPSPAIVRARSFGSSPTA